MESEIGLGQQIEFTDALERHWPEIDREKTMKFVASVKKRELNELWWLYKQAFFERHYTSATDQLPNIQCRDRLQDIIIKYRLLKD